MRVASAVSAAAAAVAVDAVSAPTLETLPATSDLTYATYGDGPAYLLRYAGPSALWFGAGSSVHFGFGLPVVGVHGTTVGPR